jgi:hypothetical protein
LAGLRRDVVLADRRAQEHMTNQFREAHDLGDSHPLDRCTCGLAPG